MDTGLSNTSEKCAATHRTPLELMVQILDAPLISDGIIPRRIPETAGPFFTENDEVSAIAVNQTKFWQYFFEGGHANAFRQQPSHA
jgi:hypothetical protein